MAKTGLGKGIDALMPIEDEAVENENKEFVTVGTAFVEPNRKQPRKHFDEEELSALSESVKRYGVLQPITVKDEKNGFYTIIAGERRWRAAKMAGLSEVPVRIVEFSSLEELEVSLIENLQRTDLDPVEEAMGYKRLMEEHSLTQEEVSKKVGKSRSAVANALRILALPEKVRELLIEKKISAGHAKAILMVNDSKKQELLAERVVSEGLSVRSAESIAAMLNSEKAKKAPSKKHEKTPEVKDLEKSLSDSLGTKVLLEEKKKGGKIEIEYYDKDQLEAIIGYLKGYQR
mgnify:FL=1